MYVTGHMKMVLYRTDKCSSILGESNRTKRQFCPVRINYPGHMTRHLGIQKQIREGKVDGTYEKETKNILVRCCYCSSL